MKPFIKSIMLPIAVLVILASSGCSGKPAPSAAETPSPYTAPSPSLPDVSGTPTDAPAQSPPYLSAGYFSTTEEMTPEVEMELFNGEFQRAYNIEFEQNMQIDLDGDGTSEQIKLLPGPDAGDASLGMIDCRSMDIQIGNSQFTARSPEHDTFFFWLDEDKDVYQTYARIIDLDKNDGRKEILLLTSNEDWQESSIVTYDGHGIKQLPWLQSSFAADGSGYIVVSEWVDLRREVQGIVIQRIKKYLPEEGRLIDIQVKYFRTDRTCLPPHDAETPKAATKWDQKLAKEPGGGETIPVPKGTEVWYGFYHESGWMQVIQWDGTLLGWLDCTKVDWDEYTDYEYTPDYG